MIATPDGVESPVERVQSDADEPRRDRSARIAVVVLFLGWLAAALAVAGSFLPVKTERWEDEGVRYWGTVTGWMSTTSQPHIEYIGPYLGVLLVAAALVLAVGAQWGAARQGASSLAKIVVVIGAGLFALSAVSLGFEIEAAADYSDSYTITVEVGGWTVLAASGLAVVASVLVMGPAARPRPGAPDLPVDN